MWRPQGLYPVAKPMSAPMLDAAPLRRSCRAAACSTRRCWSSILRRRWRCAPFLFPGAQAAERRGQDLHLHRAGRRATTCCSAIPASSRSPTPCSTASAATASAIALYALGRDLGRGRCRASPSRWSLASLLALADRPVLAAGARHLLRHDHAGGRLRLRRPGLAAVVTHRRRGRPLLPACRSCCGPASRCSTRRCSASPINGRHAHLLPRVRRRRWSLFLALLRIVNSPFGRVLQAIRENEFRAEALGYRTVLYRTVANCLAAGMAALAGALNALWLRYTGPDTTLSLRHHARHPADGGDRRHGHDVRRGDRRHAVHRSRRTTCRR